MGDHKQQAYHLTINYPEEYQNLLKTTKNQIIKHLKDNGLVYIVAMEQCTSGKAHVHIGYLASDQKTTSNETKKFNKFYPFKKSEYPNAIIHKKHSCWKILVGYIAKDTHLANLDTNIDLCDVDEYKQNYENFKQTNQLTRNEPRQELPVLTVNQTADKLLQLLMKLHKEDPTRYPNSMCVRNEVTFFMSEWFRMGLLKYNTYQKINKQTLSNLIYESIRDNPIEIESDDDFI